MNRRSSDMEAQLIRLEHKMVGGQHVFTSPDMPELWVTHAELDIAKSEIEPVMQAIMRLKGQAATVVVPKLVELEAA